MSDFVLKIAGGEPTPHKAAPTGRWITVAEAVKRSGLVAGHINRMRLTEGWEHRGLARKAKLPSGQCGWEIDEGCDSRFARAKSIEQRAAEFDWNTVPKDAAAKALARLKILNALHAEFAMAFDNERDRRTKLQIITDFCARTGIDKSARTVQRWDERFNAEELPWSLLDGRLDAPPDEQPGSDFAGFYAILEDWYLNQGEPRMSVCYRLASREAIRQNLPFPCLRHAQRHIEAMSIARKVYARQGPKAFDDKCAAYCQRDYTQIRVLERGQPVVRPMESNDIWVADHHPCDVLVQAGVDAKGKPRFKRPWLSVWQDVRSRRFLGFRFLLTDPNSSTVMLVLRDAIINAGLRLPRFCYTDNGKDYDAWLWDGMTKRERRLRLDLDGRTFDGVYAQLGIGHMHAKPYNAKAKPLERWFREFEEQWDVLQPTYCGRDPQQKPEQLAKRLERGMAPTFEAWSTEAASFITDAMMISPSSGHGMDGYSPLEVYNANVGAVVRPIRQEQLDCCLQLVNKPVKIGRNGITVGKRLYGKGDPALRQLAGREVLVRIDPSDIRYATVWSLSGDRLATVAENELAIFDTLPDAIYREALAKQTRHNRQLKEVQKRGMRIVKNPTEILIEERVAEARKRAADRPLPTPPSPGIELVNTGLEAPSTDARPAFKQAAGGEVGLFNSTLAAMAEED